MPKIVNILKIPNNYKDTLLNINKYTNWKKPSSEKATPSVSTIIEKIR